MIAIPNNPLFPAQTPLYEHTVHIEREQHGLVCFQENHRWTIEFSGFDSVAVLHRTSGDHSPMSRSPLRHLPQHKAAHLHFPYHIKTTSPRHILHTKDKGQKAGTFRGYFSFAARANTARPPTPFSWLCTFGMDSSEKVCRIDEQGECYCIASLLEPDERDTNQLVIESHRNASLVYCDECKEIAMPAEGCASSSLPLEPFYDPQCSSSYVHPKRVCVCGVSNALVGSVCLVLLLPSIE